MGKLQCRDISRKSFQIGYDRVGKRMHLVRRRQEIGYHHGLAARGCRAFHPGIAVLHGKTFLRSETERRGSGEINVRGGFAWTDPVAGDDNVKQLPHADPLHEKSGVSVVVGGGETELEALILQPAKRGEGAGLG